jgi:hypothetical protein
MRWELGCRLPVVPVALQPTQHAGHAPELTRVSAATGRPLIVAVSGDGVYNEVVNDIFDVSLLERWLLSGWWERRQPPAQYPTGCH